MSGLTGRSHPAQCEEPNRAVLSPDDPNRPSPSKLLPRVDGDTAIQDDVASSGGRKWSPMASAAMRSAAGDCRA
jgi:hypothetical protein